MDKLGKIFVAAMICLVVFSVVVYALSLTFTFHQTLTVPTAASFGVYRQDGETPITSMDDVSALWQWTSSQFILQIVIKNTGNKPLNTSFSMSGLGLAGWIFSFGGNGSLSIGQTQSVSITATPPNTIGGTTTGDFDTTIIALA